jgi:hypothetical protein
MTQFKPGKSGNPAGRPKGVKDRRVALREKLFLHADQLIEIVTLCAKSGDMTAMRIVMERIIPPLREDPINVTVPKIECVADCAHAQSEVIQAVACGEILASEGQAISNLIEAQRRAYETTELAQQMHQIQTEITEMKERRP